MPRSMVEFDVVYSHSLRLLKAMILKARLGPEIVRALYPLYRRRRMQKRAREKRAARAAAGAAAAFGETIAGAAKENEEPNAETGDEAVASPVDGWWRKGSA